MIEKVVSRAFALAEEEGHNPDAYFEKAGLTYLWLRGKDLNDSVDLSLCDIRTGKIYPGFHKKAPIKSTKAVIIPNRLG